MKQPRRETGGAFAFLADQKKAMVLISMLSRIGAPGGVSGSSKALWPMKRRAPVGLELIGLEQDRLVRRHAREVPPAMLWGMPQHEDLAVALAIAQLHRDEIRIRRRGDVAHAERQLLDGLPQRLPEIVERDPRFQQLARFAGQQLAHAQQPDSGV